MLLLCQSLDQSGGVERFACALANHLVGAGFAAALGSVDTPASAVAYPLAPGVRLLTKRPAPLTAAEAPVVPRGANAAMATAWPVTASSETAFPVTASPVTASPPGGAGTGLARRWRLARQQWRTGSALAGLVRAERPDVVILNGLTTACSVLLFCPGCAVRVICCDHNHFEARSRPWRWLRARLYPKVAALVSLTEADAPKFRALNPRTVVIANASLLQREDPGAEGAVAERSVGRTVASEQPPVLVLAIGRCVAQKGFDLLLQAWQLLLRQPGSAAARLRIVGDGPLRDTLVAEGQRLGVDASVEWLPPTADIERHYREAAVFVLPSRYEGLPLVLLEAQAMGLPAVAFDCPTGPAEVITPDTGIVVPAQDVPALAEALATLLAQPALRRRMGRAAWQRSRERYGPEAHFAGWTALIRQVAGPGAARQADA